MIVSAVIFDLDGTITRPFLDFDIIRKDIGITGDGGSILEAMEKMDLHQRERAWRILLRHEEEAALHAELNPGVREILTELRRRSIKTGILTRNSIISTRVVLDKFELEFDAIVTREDGPVKPDAFGVVSLCRQFRVSPDSVLLVGDYLHDLLTARNAGALAVLLKTHKNALQFEKFADFSIDRLEEVVEIIDKLKGKYAETYKKVLD